MKRLMATLMLACSMGCAGPVPVFVTDTADIEHIGDSPSAEIRDMLDEAFGVWGVTWTPSMELSGSVEITFTALGPEDDVNGNSVRDGDCDKSIVVEYDTLVLAHEIGHVFHLGPHTLNHDEKGHDPEPGRVMHSHDLGWDVTHAQVDVVQEDAERFSRCR